MLVWNFLLFQLVKPFCIQSVFFQSSLWFRLKHDGENLFVVLHVNFPSFRFENVDFSLQNNLQINLWWELESGCTFNQKSYCKHVSVKATLWLLLALLGTFLFVVLLSTFDSEPQDVSVSTEHLGFAPRPSKGGVILYRVKDYENVEKWKKKINKFLSREITRWESRWTH